MNPCGGNATVSSLRSTTARCCRPARGVAVPLATAKTVSPPVGAAQSSAEVATKSVKLLFAARHRRTRAMRERTSPRLSPARGNDVRSALERTSPTAPCTSPRSASGSSRSLGPARTSSPGAPRRPHPAQPARPHRPALPGAGRMRRASTTGSAVRAVPWSTTSPEGVKSTI
jgi:hypothetical protein